MVTKHKAAVFIIVAMFSSITSAAYTTMTIEGVKQANGVWTAAGVMDTSGFVRSTGAVTVSGYSASTAVAMQADRVAATSLLKGASRLAGPLVLAATAYDVYSWFTSGDVTAADNEWILKNSNSTYGQCNILYSNPVKNVSSTQCAAILQAQYTRDVVKICPYNSTYPFVYRLNSCSGMEVGNLTNPYQQGQKPTDSDFNNIPLAPYPVLSSGFSKLPSLSGVPIPITSIHFPPFSQWMGDPYYKDGNWYRDRMDISPSGTTSSPTRVRVDIGPVKIQGQTDPNTTPDTGPAGGTGGAPQPEKEKPTFCEANPMSIACAEMGELKDEKLEVEERPVDVSYTPWGSSTSQCPADKVIPLWEGQSIAISYSPVCQFASLLRPLVIALAFVTAGFIVAGITRKGGGDA